MVDRAPLLLARLAACVMPVLPVAAQAADMAALRGVLPDEVVGVLEVAAPEAAVRELLAAAGSLPRGVPPEVLAPVGLGLTAVSIVIGGDPAAWAGRMFGGGVAIGVLPAAAGARTLLVARPGDAAAARTWCERFAAGKFALDGDLLLMSADEKDVALLRRRTGAPASRWGTADLGPPRAVRGAVDLAAIRALPGVATPAFERLGGAARFFGAPIVQALASAAWLRIGVEGGGALTLTAEADASVRGTAFGELLPAATAHRLPPLPADGLASLRFERSLRTLLAEPARFLSPADVLAVQSFLSIADAVDGARSSFVADLLGGLHEPFVLHVVPAADAADAESPVLLPGFVLVAKLADPAVEPILNRTAQVLMTIVNAERMQRGQSPFQMRMQRTERGHGLVAEPAPWRGPGRPPIDSELAPTLWFEAGCVAIASTRAAAEAVLAGTADAEATAGDRLVLRGPALAAAIAANRGVLELARLLDEGEGRDGARRFVDIAVAVTAAVRELSITIHTEAAATRLRVTMERAR